MVEMSLTGIQYLYTDCTDYHSLGPTLAGGWQSCGAGGCDEDDKEADKLG